MQAGAGGRHRQHRRPAQQHQQPGQVAVARRRRRSSSAAGSSSPGRSRGSAARRPAGPAWSAGRAWWSPRWSRRTLPGGCRPPRRRPRCPGRDRGPARPGRPGPRPGPRRTPRPAPGPRSRSPASGRAPLAATDRAAAALRASAIASCPRAAASRSTYPPRKPLPPVTRSLIAGDAEELAVLPGQRVAVEVLLDVAAPLLSHRLPGAAGSAASAPIAPARAVAVLGRHHLRAGLPQDLRRLAGHRPDHGPARPRGTRTSSTG